MLMAGGKTFEDIYSYFARNHIKLKKQWLEDLLKYLITYRKNTRELINMVFYQWLYTEIGQSMEAAISADFQHQLKNPQIFQIRSIADIGTPKLKQFKKMTDPGYDESTAELGINDFTGNNFNPNKCTKCYCLQLTDCQGRQFKAFEKKRVSQLSLSTSPGSKILVFGGTKIQQGVFFLTPENCQFLGGAVERLLIDENILKQLAEQLGKPFVGANNPTPALMAAVNNNDLPKPQQQKMMPPALKHQQQQPKMPPTTIQINQQPKMPPTAIQVNQQLKMPPTAIQVNQQPKMPPTAIQVNQQPKMPPTTIQQHLQQTKMPPQIIQHHPQPQNKMPPTTVQHKTTQLKNEQPPISILQQPKLVPPNFQHQHQMKPTVVSKIPILLPSNSNAQNQNQQSKNALLPPSADSIQIQQQGTSMTMPPKSTSSIIQQPKVVAHKLPLANSSNIQPEMDNQQNRKRCHIDAKVVDAYKSLGVNSLAEVYNKMNYSIGCKRFTVIAIIQEITAPFRIVDDKWSMSVALIDESQRRLECTLEHELLLNLVMITPKEAQEIKSNGSGEKKREGVERLQLMQEQLMRLDLIFEVEVMFRGKMPMIKSVQTLADRLGYV